MASILDLKIGEIAKITAYSSLSIPPRICEMGLLPGIILSVVSKTFLNQTIFVQNNQSNLKIILRKTEAKYILIEKL
ncbi:MAG: ferrous iron transport protein A [Solirubrobacteraceae bacterium]